MKKNEWIPVSARLPEHGATVLIVFGEARIIGLARFYRTTEIRWLDACHGLEEYNPDFWQPLPDPPPKRDPFIEWYQMASLRACRPSGLDWYREIWDAAIESTKK